MSAPTSGSADSSPVEGFYPDPSIPGYIRYWSGTAWVPGTSRPAPAEGEPMPAPPAGAAPSAAPALASPVPPTPRRREAGRPAPQLPEETGPMFLDEEPALRDARAEAAGGGDGAGDEQAPRGPFNERAGAVIPPARDPRLTDTGAERVLKRAGKSGKPGPGTAGSGATGPDPSPAPSGPSRQAGREGPATPVAHAASGPVTAPQRPGGTIQLRTAPKPPDGVTPVPQDWPDARAQEAPPAAGLRQARPAP
ncbi:DUF2510 domain-containing protein, partial [Streptomyces stramineus]